MSIYDLGSAQNDREVTFTIPKEYDKYFVVWYQDQKKEGETPKQFVLRILGKEAISWYRQYKLKQLAQDNLDTMYGAGDDEATFLSDNNL